MAHYGAILQDAATSLETDPEYSNVTDLRKQLLPVIDRIEADPSLKLLVLRRGKPQAVLMSVKTYNAMRKAVDLWMRSQASLDRQEQIDSALQRLYQERPVVAYGRADAGPQTADSIIEEAEEQSL